MNLSYHILSNEILALKFIKLLHNSSSVFTSVPKVAVIPRTIIFVTTLGLFSEDYIMTVSDLNTRISLLFEHLICGKCSSGPRY